MTLKLVTDVPENSSVSYAFTLAFKVGGVVDSTLSREQTLERLHKELTDFYGDGGYEIVDFRQATEEEIELYRQYLTDEDATIN